MKSKSSPWNPTDATVAVSIAAAATRRRTPHVLDGQPNDWQPPTGDTQRFVTLVSPDEMTCLGCFETFPAGGYCQRCGQRDGESNQFYDADQLPPAVPTLSYLEPGEYRL
jgi:hypothetical protein